MSSAHVPAGYTRATLYVFQPIQYVDPGDWTGYQLTDDALFSNPAHPMAQATYADNPLIWPDQSMPPYWDGLYELRMYFSGPGKTPWTSSYPAAVIKVTGNTWILVQGGGSSCTNGKAESVETFLLPKSETAVPKPAGYADTWGKSGSKEGSTTPTTTTPTTTTPTTTTPTTTIPTTTTPTTTTPDYHDPDHFDPDHYDPDYHDPDYHDPDYYDPDHFDPDRSDSRPLRPRLLLRPLSGAPRRPLWRRQSSSKAARRAHVE